MKISVVHALPERQTVLELELPDGATAEDAIDICLDLPEFSGVPLLKMPIGVYGRVVTPDTMLQAGDRLEFYRPLQADPKEARRNRSAKTRR